jgi:hypothetical protein
MLPHNRVPTRDGDGFRSMSGGVPLYHDDDHVSLAGARFLSPAFDVIFTPRVE